MSECRLVVFAYNFPHQKSEDFLFKLHTEGYRVHHVIAADPVRLSIPPSTVRTKVRHLPKSHPREVAASIGAEYHVMPHSGDKILEFLRDLQPDVGIIAGARILKRPVIEAFKTGIINFHPGLIPEARGLDALLWSVLRGIPLGVTAHLIDRHVDAGTVLLKQCIPIYPDDTVFDLSERLYETQITMMAPAIERALRGEGDPIDPLTPHNGKMSSELEETALSRVPEYTRLHSK